MPYRPDAQQALQTMYHSKTVVKDGVDSGIPELVRELKTEDLPIPIRNK
jgi:branched-chain amino acid transport system substrate-binding protein